MPVRAVLFDLGDTLIFSAHAADPALLFPAMARQVQPLLDQWNVVPSIDLPSLLNEVHLAAEAAQPARRAHGLEVDGPFITRGAFAAFGGALSEAQSRELWRASAVDLRLWGAQLYPDTVETLRALRAAGIAAAIVSNSTQYSDIVRRQLAPMGITADLAPVIVTSTDIMRVKPDPAPFERALAALGVPPSDALFVGDSLEADVRGAKALGVTTVWKLNGRHEVAPEPEADYMIHDLWELFILGVLPAAVEAAFPQESLMPQEDANPGRY